jgi:hypothetical protein
VLYNNVVVANKEDGQEDPCLEYYPYNLIMVVHGKALRK